MFWLLMTMTSLFNKDYSDEDNNDDGGYPHVGGTMNTEEIIKHIDGEISKLQQAKGLLLGTDSPIKRSPGRPKKKATVARILAVKPAKGVMSAEGKAKIAAAQKARWAKVRKAAKAPAKKAVMRKSAKKAVKATPAKSAVPTSGPKA
jgi:hypothetical protein